MVKTFLTALLFCVLAVAASFVVVAVVEVIPSPVVREERPPTPPDDDVVHAPAPPAPGLEAAPTEQNALRATRRLIASSARCAAV